MSNVIKVGPALDASKRWRKVKANQDRIERELKDLREEAFNDVRSAAATAYANKLCELLSVIESPEYLDAYKAMDAAGMRRHLPPGTKVCPECKGDGEGEIQSEYCTICDGSGLVKAKQ